jgi:hypothetical protein
VFVNSKLDAGPDKVICSPTSNISLLSLNGGQSWRYFANGSLLPTPTVTANNVTGMTQDGKYYFILEQSGGAYCADTIIVERKPSPNAGADQVGNSGGICESQTTAKLVAAGSGQTWSQASNSIGFGMAEIDQAGNVTKLFKIGKYLFVLTQGGCRDTVMVERKARSSAGADMSICEPETSATLATASTGETWTAMANNPSSSTFGANGKVSGLTGIGVYEFVLTSANGCTDTTKVTRFARPNAGADLVGNNGICSSVSTAKLSNAPTGTTWSIGSKPTGTNPAIDAATGAITGLTVIGTYEFILQNTTTLCADSVKVEIKAIPTFDLTALQATCTTGAANPDAKLSISGLNLTNKFDYSEGTTYTGTKTFATASDITATTMTVTLANPTADKSYTVRVFNANGCFTDKTVVLKTRVCECKPDVCIPYSYKKTK